jgi:hypothetical protein
VRIGPNRRRRKLSVFVLLGAVALGSYASAQDTPVVVAKPRCTADAMRKQISGETVTCRLADKSEYLVTTAVAVGGKTYRCITVLNEKLEPAGTAWTLAE